MQLKERCVKLRDASESDRFRFKRGSKSFLQQYDKFYGARLTEMKTMLMSLITNRWGNDIPIRQICDPVPNEQCILIGTLFKHMELQPSILKDISEEIDVPVQPVTAENYTSDGDVIYLEDMVQRIALVGEFNKHEYVTGVVLAVRGVEEESNPGLFKVDDVCLPTIGIPPAISDASDCDILLVSGLEIGGSRANQMAFNLLADYVSGELDGGDNAKSIVRLFVVGNSISHEVADKEHHYKAKYLTKNAVAGTVDAVQELNKYLKRLTQTVPVTILPGESDPTNFILPQQPLHPCMLNDESDILETATNPYICQIDGLRLLGHSGQPVSNIRSYSKLEGSLEIMKKCLQWCHIAPTAPDTLASYPYTTEDPFVMKTCPHLFFCGNQPNLEGGFYTIGDHRCLCLSLPKFSETGMCVKVNLKTLNWEPVCFITETD